jgi:hypothetical protein
MMPQFKSKTVIVDAMRYDGTNCDEIIKWINLDDYYSADCKDSLIHIKNTDNVVYADKNSWIVSLDGEYVVRSDSFMTKHYDIIEEWA